MRIVVEGPDNSGKSTLCAALAEALNMPLIEGRGPPRSLDEINDRALSYLLKTGIFDRHPCVSNPIFDKFRAKPLPIRQGTLDAFYADQPFFIYCRGRDTLEGQIEKEHDLIENAGEPHSELVKRSHLGIQVEYDKWAIEHAHLIYRMGETTMDTFIGGVKRGLSSARFNPVADIEEFHKKFGLEYDGPPRALQRELFDFRSKFLEEELKEYRIHAREAYKERDYYRDQDLASYAHHLEHALDGLVDLVYVALGTSYLHGFDFRTAWERVHTANMKKVRAERAGDSKRGSTFDVVKPPGWEPPRHIDLIEQNDMINPETL